MASPSIPTPTRTPTPPANVGDTRPLSSGRYLILIVAFVLTWSSAFAVGKLSVHVSPPLLFLALRFLLAGGIMLAWEGARGRLPRFRSVAWGRLFLLGILTQAGYIGLAWVAMERVSSALTAIIISANPIFIAAMARPVLGERVSFIRTVGLLLGLLGVVIVLRHRIVVSGEDAAGVALVLVALASLVSGTLIYKKWSPHYPLSVLVGGQFLGAGLTLGLCGLALESPGDMILGFTFYWTLAYHVFVVSLGAIVLWFFLLRRMSATSASAFHFLMPPLGLLFGWLFLKEPVDPSEFIGIAPIAVGIWLVTQGNTIAPFLRRRIYRNKNPQRL